MLGPKQEAQAALPPIPHFGFLFVRVKRPGPILHLSHSIFQKKIKVLRSPFEITGTKRSFTI